MIFSVYARIFTTLDLALLSNLLHAVFSTCLFTCTKDKILLLLLSFVHCCPIRAYETKNLNAPTRFLLNMKSVVYVHVVVQKYSKCY